MFYGVLFMKNEKTFKTVTLAMLSAIAFVLFLLEFPIIPGNSYLKLDLSEIPVLAGGIMFGPATVVVIEAVKNIIELLVKGLGTQMGFGNLMNFIVGCAYCLPFVLVYRKLSKTKKPSIAIIISSVIGIVSIVVFGMLGNMLIAPLFFKYFMGVELSKDALIVAVESATIINCVKGAMLSIVSFPLVNVLLKKLKKANIDQ